MSSHPSLDPYDPPAILEHPTLLVLRDMHGRRWRVSDVSATERPIVRRRPPDPATQTLYLALGDERWWQREVSAEDLSADVAAYAGRVVADWMKAE